MSQNDKLSDNYREFLETTFYGGPDIKKTPLAESNKRGLTELEKRQLAMLARAKRKAMALPEDDEPRKRPKRNNKS